MTYNELKRKYKGYRFRVSAKDWKIIKKTKGTCKVLNYNADDEDKDIFVDITY